MSTPRRVIVVAVILIAAQPFELGTALARASQKDEVVGAAVPVIAADDGAQLCVDTIKVGALTTLDTP